MNHDADITTANSSSAATGTIGGALWSHYVELPCPQAGLQQASLKVPLPRCIARQLKRRSMPKRTYVHQARGRRAAKDL